MTLKWVMTTRRVKGGIEIAIGRIHIASIRWTPSGAVLWFTPTEGSGTIACKDTSEAFKKMHEVLNSPPDEDLGWGSRNRIKES